MTHLIWINNMFAQKYRVGLVLIGGLSSTVFAGDVDLGTFSLSNGVHAASAGFVFDDVANTLEIVISNTMTGNGPNQWLCGVFFDLNGAQIDGYDPTGLQASMITVKDLIQTPYAAHTADQFWGMRDDISNGELPFGDQQYGLGAAGFGVFGASDMLVPGGPHPQPDGSDGGILGTFGGLDLPNGHENRPMILGSLTLRFNLENVIAPLKVDDIAFVYGTGFDETVLTSMIPLPSGAALAAGGLGLLFVRRRREG